MIRAGIRRVFRLAAGGRRRWEREVEEEITLHLALRTEQLIAQGSSPDAAVAEAIRRFGPLTDARARLIGAARNRERHMQRTEYFADLRQDLAFALRTLRRLPGWTAVTLITLGLGIGATTAVFSAVSSLLLHPLPYPHADRVVLVDWQPTAGNMSGMNVSILPSASVVRAWRQGAHSLEAIEGYASVTMAMQTTSGDPSSITGIRVFPSFTHFAGTHPLRGRMFDSSDVAAGGRVVLLGEAFWRTRFGADQSVIGRAITLDDTLYTIIGVMPASARSPEVGAHPEDVWLPLDIHNDDLGMGVVARMRPGVTPGIAKRDLDAAWQAVRSPGTGPLPFVARVITPAQTLRFRDSLVMLTAAVALVMLVACANVAHLIVARSAARRRELAVRAALGAGRARIFRQLLTESVLLSGAGALLGVGIGWIGLHALVAMRPRNLTALDAAHLDGTTLALAIGITVLCALAFGVIATVQTARSSAHEALKAGATNASASRAHARGRAALVVSEMALCATLVVGATMLVRSVINLQRADLGFDPHGLYDVELVLPRRHFPNAEERTALMRAFLERMRGVGGITQISVASTPPGSRRFSVGRLEVEGEAERSEQATSLVDVNAIDEHFFRTMGMHLTQGSFFTDTSQASRQVIINDGFARAHWPGQSALGHRVRVAASGTEPWLTIVGVANDAATSGPTSESSGALLYSPIRTMDHTAILVRTSGEAKVLAPLRTLAQSLAPHASARVESIEGIMARSVAAPRFVTLLLTVFTLLALVLAAVGMYGVMAYMIIQKTREIGIRVALGASREHIAASVLLRGALLALVGAALGMAAAVWGTKLIEHELFGVARSDAASFAAAAAVLVGTALVACVVPTRRALAVDPMTAIRAD